MKDIYRIGNLLLYKGIPSLLVRVGDKLDIQLRDGVMKRVREKDITYLHSGPVNGFDELHTPDGDIQTAWELLEGSDEPFDIAYVAGLIYGDASPSSVLSTWDIIEDGLYFAGTPTAVKVRSKTEVEHILGKRREKVEVERAKERFINHVNDGYFRPEDSQFLYEIEQVAMGRSESARILHQLRQSEDIENAHRFLLELGYWNNAVNPYPSRYGLQIASPDLAIPSLPDEERVDLTHLESYAIDDIGNNDPDDAISIDGNRLWVHVADVAALVHPDSDIDLEARGRGETLYLPENTARMLPENLVQAMGLGLSEVSTALSFGIYLDENAQISDVVVVQSRVRVERLTYDQVDTRMGEEPFKRIQEYLQPFLERRSDNGALFIDLPEVKVKVNADGIVENSPVHPLASRIMVREAMLLAGEAAGVFAQKNNLPFPYVVQDSYSSENVSDLGDSESYPEEDWARAYLLRKKSKRSQLSGFPGWHAGIGLRAYTRSTSPLRRYMDLVVHQQIRAFLHNENILDEGQILERVGSSQAVSRNVKQAEWRSIRHWTLVFMLQNPDRDWEGVLVEKRGKRAVFIIPDIALTVQVYLQKDLPLNSRVALRVKKIDLPELDVFCEILN